MMKEIKAMKILNSQKMRQKIAKKLKVVKMNQMEALKTKITNHRNLKLKEAALNSILIKKSKIILMMMLN